MLVAQQVRGGLELVLGLHRDPSGPRGDGRRGRRAAGAHQGRGVLRPAGSRDKARDMLRRTRVARLIEGYRGSEPRDVGAIIDALVGLGQLALDCPDVIESVDINPFAALPQAAHPAAWRLMP